MTQWKPKIEIWFYNENYLRFTSDNYDPNQLHNKYAQLTNATINKENIKEDKFKEHDVAETDKTLKIVGNMYTSNQFEEYLRQYSAKNDLDDKYPNGPFKD